MKVTHVKPENWIDTSEEGVIQPSGVAGLVHEIVLEEGDLMQGPQGEPGVKGDTGEAGPQGEPGVKGDTGEAGPQGVPGVKGDTGEAGPQGVQGVKGDTGAAGPQGVPGVKGGTGAAGPQGVPGVKGDTGAVGAKGETGSVSLPVAFGIGSHMLMTGGASLPLGDLSSTTYKLYPTTISDVAGATPSQKYCIKTKHDARPNGEVWRNMTGVAGSMTLMMMRVG